MHWVIDSSPTTTSGQTAAMIASRSTTRPGFSTRSRSSANDFGRSGTSAPSGPSKAPRARSRVNRSKRQAAGGVRSVSIGPFPVSPSILPYADAALGPLGLALGQPVEVRRTALARPCVAQMRTPALRAEASDALLLLLALEWPVALQEELDRGVGEAAAAVLRTVVSSLLG